MKQKKYGKKDRVPLNTKACKWKNAAEIEISVMDEDCTDRRIGDIAEMLVNEVAA